MFLNIKKRKRRNIDHLLKSMFIADYAEVINCQENKIVASQYTIITPTKKILNEQIRQLKSLIADKRLNKDELKFFHYKETYDG